MSEEPPKPPEKPRPWMTLLAMTGILWMFLSGICSAAFVLPMIFNPYAWSSLFIILPIAFVCLAPGLMMWMAGRRK